MNQDAETAQGLHMDHVSQKRCEFYPALFHLVENVYQDVEVLDLSAETMFVLRNFADRMQEGTTCPYAHEADLFCSRRIMAEDYEIARKTLSLEELRRFYNSGQKSERVELRVCAREFTYEWVELSIFSLAAVEDDAPKVLIAVRSIDDQKLLRGIVDRFVYDSCDYFIYIDAKADSYVMFSGSDSGTPLPPTICSSYSKEVIQYARDFVTPEEQENTIAQMELSYVLNVLNEHGEHIFYSSVIDPLRGDTRKCLKYRYYDRENQRILLVRTDVTDVYRAEKAENDKLRRALEAARTDPLTGLYNRNALESLVTARLSPPAAASSGALFFLDADNFKQINDQFGHQRGDRLLRFLSEKLRCIIPENGIIGRYGGDEFVVFCAEMGDTQSMEALAAKICCVFDDIEERYAPEVSTSCSVGIARYPKDGVTFEGLCDCADKALYRAKHEHKKGFAFFA